MKKSGTSASNPPFRHRDGAALVSVSLTLRVFRRTFGRECAS
jgi:hypothetical protein